MKMYNCMKRIFDLVFSVMLMFLFMPFWWIFAVLIKIDSKGPIIFKQKRVGKNGIHFIMLKFRTMHLNTASNAFKPLDQNDLRITNFGKFLRSRGLDESLQLINVFKGEMSLIGPRPEMPFIVQNYQKIHLQRLQTTPGITGLWQILAPKDVPIHNNLKYDIFYLRKRNICLDFWILVQTARILFGERKLV